MEAQKLEELIPHEVEVTLKKVESPLKVRACTLADDLWAIKKFGKDIETVLLKPEVESIINIFYRLLETESQAYFMRRPVTIIDEAGVEIKREIGGAELLMQFVSGGKELTVIAKAIMESVGFSRPVLEAAEKQELKKKLTTHNPIKMDGPSSLTSSPTNTVGPQNTSSAEH